MSTNGSVIGIVGSPNLDGRTNELISAALDGAASTGGVVEKIQLADHVVDACKDCLPWVCKDNLECTYPDEAFELLSQKLLDCGALILGTPVYWWDTSGMIKYLILKMFRVYARTAPLKGMPAFGIGIAGGTGNGLISGLRPGYHFFQVMHMRAIEPLPVTRLNFKEATERARELGEQIAQMAKQRMPFNDLEERLLWYDALPYLGMSRMEERRLLAGHTTQALPKNADPDIACGLARADVLSAAGRKLESMKAISQVYDAGIEIFEKK